MKTLKIIKVGTLLVGIMMITILLCCSGQIQAAQDGDYIYSVTAGNAQITKYTGVGGDVTVPSTLGGAPVTSIGNYAFMYCRVLNSISIPQGVTSIGNNAFSGCSGLKSISIPLGVTSIGSWAFQDCAALTVISMPQGLRSIGETAFYGCTVLNAVNIPKDVTSIGNAAFANCRALTAITVDADNLNYESLNGVLYNKALTTLIACPGGSITVNIPQSVTSIGYCAFSNCRLLTSIVLPQGLISIANEAFTYCTALKSISIPQGVTIIGGHSFDNCTSLTSVTLPEGVTIIGNNAFFHCPALKNINIPENVTSIGSNAFYGCTSLTSITIPEGVKIIGSYAFSSCSGLTTFNIPQSVTSIGTQAFQYCSRLTSIIFNSAETVIYDSSYTIPTTVKIIGYDPSTAKDYATKYNRTFESLGTNLPIPTVSINSPTNNSSYMVGDVVEIRGSGVNCDHIGLFVDDVSVGGATKTGNNYSYDYTVTSEGTHTIQLKGRNAAEGTIGSELAESLVVAINVLPAPIPKPVITVFSPSNGATYQLGATLPLSANATNSVAMNAKWTLQGSTDPNYQNQLFGTQDGSNFTATFVPNVAGAYNIQYYARNSADVENDPKVVTVTVLAPTLMSISVDATSAQRYFTIGDPLDTTGLVVTGIYSNGSTKVETVTADNVTGFDNSTAVQSQILTVTVGGKTAQYVIQILANTAPVITIKGDNPAKVKALSVYSDAGATAYDSTDGNVIVTSVSNVNTSKAGQYVVTYTAEDKAGKQSIAVRLVYVMSTSSDTDGDGLLDIWEESDQGYFDPGTLKWVNLKSLGADPLRKDIFIYVDFLKNDSTLYRESASINNAFPATGTTFLTTAMTEIIDSFDKAPVRNQGLKKGIALHVEYGHKDIDLGGIRTYTDGSGNPQLDWATVDKAKSMTGTAINGVSLPSFKSSGKSGVFRYCLVGQFYTTPLLGKYERAFTSGWARGIPDNDFAINSWLTHPNKQLEDNLFDNTKIPLAKVFGRTFMHELGHTLGLQHGGQDDFNHKPNYISIMNYTYQLPGVVSVASGIQTYSPDYSRNKLASLNENNLDEAKGIGTTNFQTAYSTVANGVYAFRASSPGVLAIDWDSKSTTNNYKFNINGDIKRNLIGQTFDIYTKDLESYSDWDRLFLKVGSLSDKNKTGSTMGNTLLTQQLYSGPDTDIREILKLTPLEFIDLLSADKPLSSFSVTANLITTNSDISFDGSSSTCSEGSSPKAFEWDFGDGTTGTGAQVTHQYAEEGEYYVHLRVEDFNGNKSANGFKERVIVRANIEAYLQEEISTYTLTPDIKFTFNDFATTPTNQDVVVSATVDKGTLAQASHTYTENGSFEFLATTEDGNIATMTVTVTNIDKDLPEVTLTSPIDGATYTLDETVIANWNATDAQSGIESSTGTVTSGSAIDTSSVGTKTFTVTAKDKAGNQTTKTVTYNVHYVYGGVLSPLSNNGANSFKIGSTTPVKFQLKDSAGKYVSSASATISYAKFEGDTLGKKIDAVSTSGAVRNNSFRYALDDNQYIFNLSTKGWAAGTYQLTIKLDDGTSYTVKISSK